MRNKVGRIKLKLTLYETKLTQDEPNQDTHQVVTRGNSNLYPETTVQVMLDWLKRFSDKFGLNINEIFNNVLNNSEEVRK